MLSARSVNAIVDTFREARATRLETIDLARRFARGEDTRTVREAHSVRVARVRHALDEVTLMVDGATPDELEALERRLVAEGFR